MKKLNVLRGLILISLIILTSQVLASSKVATFSIENMTCKMCDITVRKAIEKVDGVTSAKVDYESKTAQVTFDSVITSINQIEEASTMAGYPAKVKPE
jgi:mercuric ion binding protein